MGYAEPQHFAGSTVKPGGSPGRGQQGRGQQRTAGSSNSTKINTAGAEGRSNQASVRVSGRRGRTSAWPCVTGDTRAHTASHHRVPMPGLSHLPGAWNSGRDPCWHHPSIHPCPWPMALPSLEGSGSSQPSEGSSPPGSARRGAWTRSQGCAGLSPFQGETVPGELGTASQGCPGCPMGTAKVPSPPWGDPTGQAPEHSLGQV